MILFGDKNIPLSGFTEVSTVDEIKTTPSNSIVSFKYDLTLMRYCDQNSIRYIVSIDSITQAVYANILNAMYILVDKDIAKTIQDIADNYMYDSKIIVKINSSDEIEWVALNSIDGAIIL